VDETEIVLNLWYVADEDGFIYSLRAHPYVAAGSKEEKLAFLQTRATLDYLVATPFPVPEDWHTTIRAEGRFPVTHAGALQVGLVTLFEGVFKALEAKLPSQTRLSIGQRPLVCLTPLVASGDGQLQPRTERARRLPTDTEQ
jgi:hypothetical protein